jgi:hypothetical protein
MSCPEKPVRCPNAAPPPTLLKRTPYEFLQAWNSLKSCQAVEPYLALILQITPRDFPKGELFISATVSLLLRWMFPVLSNKLEGDMLLNIIHAMEALYAKGQNWCLVGQKGN